MQIFPDHARRSIYGLRAPRVATVGRLGALGASDGSGAVTWTVDETGVYAFTGGTDYSVTVYAPRNVVQGAFDAGAIPTAIASDGGLIWNTAVGQAAYWESVAGVDVTNPASIPGWYPGASQIEIVGTVRWNQVPPGTTPREDIAVTAARQSAAAAQKEATHKALLQKAQALLKKREQETKQAERVRAEKEAAEAKARRDKILGWVASGGLTALGGLALKYFLADKLSSGDSIPTACATYLRADTALNGALCVKCLLTDDCPTEGGVVDSCSSAGLIATTTNINAAKDAATIDRYVKTVESSCGPDSPAADLIRKTGEARKKQLGSGSALLWGGLGLAAVLIIAASRRK